MATDQPTVIQSNTGQSTVIQKGGQQGNPGVAATVSVGTVTTVSPSSPALVQNSGTSLNAVLDFEIPQGETGNAATVQIGTVTTLAPGSQATASNSGSSSNLILNLGIPQGNTGADGGVTSFNSRTGIITLGSADVTGALGYTPVSLTESQQRNGVSVLDFGVNGSSTDATNMANAISYAVSNNVKLTAPAMTINLGTTPLVFPNTVPEGFCFEADPACAIEYSGTGHAVTIGSCYHAKYTFGKIINTGTTPLSSCLHIAPTAVNPALGQNACVVSEINFVFLGGAENCLFLDCNAGSISQCKINGLDIKTGYNMASGSMSGTLSGILLQCGTGFIFQGNQVNINYVAPGGSAFASGTTWVGINECGSGIVPNNVNVWNWGAIDGQLYSSPGAWDAVALAIYGAFNTYIGPIVDSFVGVQIGSGSTSNVLMIADIQVIPGGIQISDLNKGVDNSFILVNSQPGMGKYQALTSGQAPSSQTAGNYVASPAASTLYQASGTFTAPYAGTVTVSGSASQPGSQGFTISSVINGQSGQSALSYYGGTAMPYSVSVTEGEVIDWSVNCDMTSAGTEGSLYISGRLDFLPAS